METKKLLNKISSKYILKKLFDFIKDDNIQFNICRYSKYFQNKLGFELHDYQEKYFKLIGINESTINLYDFLSNPKYVGVDLNKKLNEFLIQKNINKVIIERYFLYYFNQYAKNNWQNIDNKEMYKSDLKIDIYSPFFEFLSQKENLSQIFSIIIRLNLIKENCPLKIEYINTFDKLNQIYSNYSSFTIYFEYNNEIKHLDEIKLKYEQIRKLFVERISDKDKNRLVNKNSLKINSFKSLVHLCLNGIYFKNIFTIKLYNLKLLEITNCKNITFDSNTCLKLKKLVINNNILPKKYSLSLKFPELEECYLDNFENKLIDFSSLNNLKHLKSKVSNFILLEKTLLEDINIKSDLDASGEIEQKMIEKVCSISTLQKINLEFHKINNDILDNIKNKNFSVIDAEFIFNSSNDDDNRKLIDNLLSKFPKLNKVKICIGYKFSFTIKKNGDINFYNSNFDNLIEIKIDSDYFNINKIICFFPIFDNNCNIIFTSLIHFEFRYNNYSDNISLIYNLFNNIKYLPKLKYFYFFFNISKILKDDYKTFIKQILTLKIDYIYIRDYESHNLDEYSQKELIQIAPIINIPNYKNIHIDKYHEFYCGCGHHSFDFDFDDSFKCIIPDFPLFEEEFFSKENEEKSEISL